MRLLHTEMGRILVIVAGGAAMVLLAVALAHWGPTWLLARIMPLATGTPE